MKTGLFFGSFNPVHLGHLAIAQYILNETEIAHITFVVSPHNPLKDEESLISPEKRMEMVKASIAGNPGFSASDIEFTLPRPSYTYLTLRALKDNNRDNDYTLIMGSDTLTSLPKWREAEEILSYPILVYRRSKEIVNPYPNHSNIRILDAPILDISATAIRRMLKEQKDIRYLVRDEIIDLLKIN